MEFEGEQGNDGAEKEVGKDWYPPGNQHLEVEKILKEFRRKEGSHLRDGIEQIHGKREDRDGVMVNKISDASLINTCLLDNRPRIEKEVLECSSAN